jgi:hypothetical protein
VGSDTNTKGDWLKKGYGKDGYYMVSYTSAPSYGNASFLNNLTYTWSSRTTDPRALQTPNGRSRFAPVYYTQKPTGEEKSFDIDVRFNDENTHRVSLYCLSWDWNDPTYPLDRQQRIDILDPNSGKLLDSQTLAETREDYPTGTFIDHGVYLVWDIKGSVKIRVTHIAPFQEPLSDEITGGDNAVVSGVFFDAAGTTPPTTPPTTSQ